MQIAHKVVETNELHCTGNLIGEQGISKTQQGVHRIGWGTFDTSWERPLPGITQELAKAAKVGGTACPFHAQDGLHWLMASSHVVDPLRGSPNRRSAQSVAGSPD